MKRNPWVALFSAFLTLVLLSTSLLGCSSTSREKTVVRIALSVPFNSWQTTYAIREGIISSDKVDVQISMSTDPESQLLSGNAEMAAMSTSAFASTLETADMPLRSVSTMVVQTGAQAAKGVNYLVALAGSDINSPAELVGKTVGVPELNSSSTSTFLAFLKSDYGIDESQLTLVNKSNSVLIELLRKGELDASVLGQNVGVQAYAEPETFKILWNLDETFIEKYHTPCVVSLMVVNGNFLEENRDAVEATMDLLKESAEWGDEHIEQLASEYASEFGKTAGFYQMVYNEHSRVVLSDIDGDVLDSIMAVFEFVRVRGLIDTIPDPDVVFVTL
jgi:ABC-type nitrate/sulfonate/bicarbonate transport system substrate-binding protein